MRHLTLSATVLLLSIQSFCQSSKLNQSNFWNSKQAYFGQRAPGEIPKIFAPGMLVDSGIVLGSVCFSKDGKEFYFTHARHWFDSKGSGTSQMVFDGSKWEKQNNLFDGFSNPSLSMDGSKLYLGGPGSKVWIAERNNNGWSTPVLIFEKDYGLYNFQSTNSGVFYAGSNGNQGSKKDYSTYDFCSLTVSAKDTIIKSLGSPLNTKAFDGDFYIAPDESFIIISANETPTYECELYTSFRKADKTWTKPVSLGSAINNGKAHRFGQYVTPDKKYLIYTRGTSEKNCNFYWVRIDRTLAMLKKQSLVSSHK
jgi:hypothetical protein